MEVEVAVVAAAVAEVSIVADAAADVVVEALPTVVASAISEARSRPSDCRPTANIRHRRLRFPLGRHTCASI